MYVHLCGFERDGGRRGLVMVCHQLLSEHEIFCLITRVITFENSQLCFIVECYCIQYLSV